MGSISYLIKAICWMPWKADQEQSPYLLFYAVRIIFLPLWIMHGYYSVRQCCRAAHSMWWQLLAMIRTHVVNIDDAYLDENYDVCISSTFRGKRRFWYGNYHNNEIIYRVVTGYLRSQGEVRQETLYLQAKYKSSLLHNIFIIVQLLCFWGGIRRIQMQNLDLCVYHIVDVDASRTRILLSCVWYHVIDDNDPEIWLLCLRIPTMFISFEYRCDYIWIFRCGHLA